MSTLEWIALGALLFAVIIFSMRLTRRGLTTLDDDRLRQNRRIAEAEHKIAEDRKNMSASEHLAIIMAGVEDLLRLDGMEEDCSISKNGYRIDLNTPRGEYAIELLMRERMLKSNHKVIHGRNVWLLEGANIMERHGELSALMASLQAHLHGGKPELKAPDHILRRTRVSHPERHAGFENEIDTHANTM